MTIDGVIDTNGEALGKSLSFGFESTSESVLSGIRVRPVDLARLLGVSKQGVSKWIKEGRITLGVDGRVDPRLAVNRLMATGNPAKIRATFLKPLITELSALRLRVGELENTLSAAKEDSKFNGECSSELISLLDSLKDNLTADWPALKALPDEDGLSAILSWIDHGVEQGCSGQTILECACFDETRM